MVALFGFVCAAMFSQPLPLAGLSEACVVTLHIPDSLEPDARMDMYVGTKGQKPAEGFPVYLYLHGSGPRDTEWHTGLRLARLFRDAPCMYLIPRIPNEGEWYRWWQKGKQWAWRHILRQVLSMKEVDPSRIYIFGISEGGYGSQRLASFYADYLAAAGPMAGGEPLRNAPVENLGNIGFSLLTGAEDRMFFRNMLTHHAQVRLDSIAKVYPGEYRHRVGLIAEKGHSIDYSATTPWLSQFRRKAHPRHFVWENMEMDGWKRNAFYNLQVLQEADTCRTQYEYTLTPAGEENTVTLVRIDVCHVKYQVSWTDPYWHIPMLFERELTPARHGKVRLFLTPEIKDAAKPVDIVVNGRICLSLDKIKGNRQVICGRKARSLAADLFSDPMRRFDSYVDIEW